MKGHSLRNVFSRRFRKNRLAAAGGVVVVLMFFVAVFAPFISPYNPDDIDRKHILESPSLKHPLGTDDLGRDVLSRMILGSRISLSVGFVSVGIATLIGIFLGAISGYYGGWVDSIIMRFIDIMLTIPTFFSSLLLLRLSTLTSGVLLRYRAGYGKA